MQIHRTYQLRGYTSREGYNRLDVVLRECVFLYNHFLGVWQYSYQYAGIGRSYNSDCKLLTKMRRDGLYGWDGLSVNIGRGVLRRLDRARQSFFRRVKAWREGGVS